MFTAVHAHCHKNWPGLCENHLPGDCCKDFVFSANAKPLLRAIKATLVIIAISESCWNAHHFEASSATYLNTCSRSWCWIRLLFWQEFIDEASSCTLVADAAWSFVRHQLIEMARACLTASQENRITAGYFYELHENLNTLISEVTGFWANSSCCFMSPVAGSREVLELFLTDKMFFK